MVPSIVDGDLLDQRCDAIVNAWNRNVIPWWLLLPQGVSGAIKRRGGVSPFREVARHGAIPLGGAVLTTAGRLPYRGIIHVAGINLLWRSSDFSISALVRNAMRIAVDQAFCSVAFPIIGAGSGGMGQDRALQVMLTTLAELDHPCAATIVRFKRTA